MKHGFVIKNTKTNEFLVFRGMDAEETKDIYEAAIFYNVPTEKAEWCEQAKMQIDEKNEYEAVDVIVNIKVKHK